MKTKIAIASLFLLVISSFAKVTETQTSNTRGTYTSSQIVKNISDAYWQRELSENLYLRIQFGMPISELTDISYGSARSRLNFSSTLYGQLKRAKKTELSHEELLTLKLLEWELLNTMQSFQFFWLNSPVTPYASPINTVHLAFTSYQFKEAKDPKNYLQLLEKYVAFITSIQNRMQDQVKMKIVLPVDELNQVVPFVTAYIREPSKSLFFVESERLKNIPQADAAKFQDQVSKAIQDSVNPSVKKLADYLDGDYRKNTGQPVGLSQYPNGKEYYQLLVKYHTTMNVTPQEVHQIGLDEVKRIQDRMSVVRGSLQFKGTKEEFQKYIETDPRFIPKTPDEIGQKLMASYEKILPKIDSYFLKQPKAPCGVKRLDPALEGSMTFGYYQVPTKADPTGYYYYNGSKLNERSLLDSASLIYHELVPGHHFQINLQSENETLPDFRKQAGQTAYVEGWAEYAAGLAEEMGMYEDPYDLYGRLTADLFLTVRLVVDTGMNDMGWSRAKAMEYMKQNSFLSETEIQTESLRYSTDIPGQALAYKMGSRKIIELRKKCSDSLKDKFDIRKFHEAVLGGGSMPMAILEEHIDWFIESEVGKPAQ